MSLDTLYADAVAMHQGLVACFNAVADGRFDDQRLKNLVKVTLESNGLNATMPLADLLDDLEPLSTGTIVEEANLLTQSSEEAQLRMRLLLKSPHEVYGLSPLGDDDLFAPFAPVVADEITRLHTAYIPYAHQTAENFLTAAATYPSAPGYRADIDAIEDRRGRVAQEYVKLQNGMLQGAMSIGELDAFYRGYTDMSFHPARDYKANTNKMAETHIEIAKMNSARLTLRITQMFLILTDPLGRATLANDPSFKADFDTKAQETANGFQRTKLHLEGGTVTDGAIYGAHQYMQIAKAFTI